MASCPGCLIELSKNFDPYFTCEYVELKCAVLIVTTPLRPDFDIG